MGLPRLSPAALARSALCALGALGVLGWSGCADEAHGATAAIAELRPDDPDAGALPDAFPADVTVEHVDGERGMVRVHFTREGAHAIPLDDADADGLPDYARDVAREYEAALAFYTTALGLALPLADDIVLDHEGNHGGDAKLDVYLVDFPTRADGAFRVDLCLEGAPRRCAGHMIHENDFDGRSYRSLAEAHRTVASHELFHAIQHAYDASAGVVIAEGSAVWASEVYAPELTDFERSIGGYFERPERSLAQEPTGPVDPFGYGSAIFFRFLEERFEREVPVRLWRRLGDGPEAVSWLAALDDLLRGSYGSSLGEAYAELVRWNLYTGSRADAERSYAEGARYPQLTEREVELPYADERLRVFPLSARHFAADVIEAGDVYLEAIENDRPLDGLRLLLAVESRGKITALESARVEDAPRLMLPAARGDRVHAALLSTLADGESLQPRVCFAREGDGAPCEHTPREDDASADEGEADAGAAGAVRSERSGACACALPGRASRTTALSLLGSLALACLLRRSPRKPR